VGFLSGQGHCGRAGEIHARKLEGYEQPPLDDAIRAELEEYVTRRRAERGD
jgi:trimethylamine--corrinoid protein Co-methyltransferase